jgi:ubiquinone/menaquinone biosynthesis C-methylase UbiE
MFAETNEIVIEAWNTVLFDKFLRFKHLLVAGLSAHSDELLGRGLHPTDASVIDIGCGFGDTALHLGAQVGPAGKAVGVDCAPRFVAWAEQQALESGASNVEYLVRDAQLDDLGGPYDAAFARFGTMFFNLPGAAFRNVRRALAPGAPFRQIVWRRREDNPWVHQAELAVKELLPVVAHEETDQVHCGPGPFSLAGPDLVSDLLGAAGFERITFERFDAEICIGRDADEAIDFGVSLGPAGEIVRLAGELGERRLPEVRAALRQVFLPYTSDAGVLVPSSTWFVTAHNPT